jgi:hypothetical protein
MIKNNFDKTGTIKAMAIALIVTLAGLAILGWQYQQLEEKRLPALEEELERQKEDIEKGEAQRVLEGFMAIRADGNRPMAMLYLTENTAEQEAVGQFELLNNCQSYKILNFERMSENSFHATVENCLEGIASFVELIDLLKVSDNYYIDSVLLAG